MAASPQSVAATVLAVRTSKTGKNARWARTGGVVALVVGGLFTFISILGIAGSGGAIADLVALCASLLIMILGVGLLVLATILTLGEPD